MCTGHSPSLSALGVSLRGTGTPSRARRSCRAALGAVAEAALQIGLSNKEASAAARRLAAAGMIMTLVVTALAASKRKTSAVPATDCIVTSTSVDGTEEPRDCYLIDAAEMKPGTKGMFESCTQ